MRTKWSLSVWVVLLSTVGTVAPPANAQSWTYLSVLPAPINTLYFLDHFGRGYIGFAGTSDGIYRTNNSGNTWAACPGTGGLVIRDIVFKDASTGWGIASNIPIVVKTTDSGQTWTQFTTNSGGTSIIYAASTQTLYASYFGFGNAQYSTDGGATWSVSQTQGTNGLAIADSSCAIWSSHGNYPIYFTTDGGTLWQPSNLTHHIYSPTSLGSSHSFFGLSEFDDSGYLSLDSGRNWVYRGLFPVPAANFIGPTGCVRSNGRLLWTQSVSFGMFVSEDTGKSWISLCGPSQNFDSRFYAIGTTLYAASAANLYVGDGSQIPPPVEVEVTPDTGRITIARCSGGWILLNLLPRYGCFAEIDSAYLTGSRNFVPPGLILPLPLDSLQMGVYYRDGGLPHDTAWLHLVWRTAGILKDAVIPLLGTVSGILNTLTLPTPSIDAPSCTAFDTALSIQDASCDTMTIVSAKLLDSSKLHLISQNLPAKLTFTQNFPIWLSGTFVHPGLYYDSLFISFQIGSSGRILDTVVPVRVNIHGVQPPEVNNLLIRVLHGCAPIDTVIRVKNKHCVTGMLTSITTSDSSIAFVTDTAIPLALAPDSSIAIPLRVQPAKRGTVFCTLTLTFDIDGEEFDTVLFVTLATTGKPEAIPTLNSGRIAFGLSSLCYKKSAPLVIRDGQCDSLTLLSARWTYGDSEIWFDTISLPRTLAPQETDTLWFHYQPSGNHPASGQLDLRFTLDGYTHDTTLIVSGIGTDAPTASLLTDTLSFPTITTCETGTDSSIFVNTSCDTLLITNVQDWSPSGFAAISPSLPQKIAPGDSITFVFQFAPSKNGAFRDSISLDYHSLVAPNLKPSVQLQLLGSAQTPELPLELRGAGFRTITLPPCSDWDSSFTIQNPNSCDTLSVDSIWASANSLFISSSPSLPARLAPDSAVTIHLHFVPSQDTEFASFHLFGTMLDSTLSLAFFRTRVDSFSFTPQSVPEFVTNACQPVSQTFVLTGGGLCDSVWVDSLTLSNAATKFSLSGAPQVPFLVQGTDTLRVTYDPNYSGSDSAELIVTSPTKAFSLRLPLRGSDAELPPLARCVLSVDGKTSDTLAPGARATLALRTLDAIPDSLGLSEVSFQLQFNDNLLTEQRITPAPGFILGPVQYKPGFLSLDLHHTAGASIPADGEIASIDLYVTLGDSISTPIALSDLRFNPEDSTYERCVLATSAPVDTTYVTVANSCGTPLLRTLLEGVLLTVHGIQPTVLRSGAHLSVDLSVRAAAAVQFRLFTEDGVELSNAVRSLSAGRHTLSLPLEQVPHGAAFLEISAGGESVVRKIAFE